MSKRHIIKSLDAKNRISSGPREIGAKEFAALIVTELFSKLRRVLTFRNLLIYLRLAFLPLTVYCKLGEKAQKRQRSVETVAR